jgi:hypothetical protein
MEFKVVHKGIDSLYMSFWGILKPDVKEELETKKKLAQSEDLKEQSLAMKKIGEHSFEVQDKGKGKFAYVLKDNWFYIEISASKRMITPTIYVQISSELINCLGLDYAVNELRTIVEELIRSILIESVSRADIFVDFVTDMDFENVKRKSWVTRAEKITAHWVGIPFSGWTIGLGGDIGARIYDKTGEIIKSQKDFFKEIWLKQEWQEGQRVMRLEFELGKNFLNEMSVNSVSDLLITANDIWRTCTQDWLRLAIDNGTINRTEWSTEPVWTSLQQVRFEDGDYAGVVRQVNRSRVPTDRTIFLNGMGYVLSYQAREGFDNTSEAIMRFASDADKFLAKYTMNSKQFASGEDYKQTKLALKKKRFNKKPE